MATFQLRKFSPVSENMTVDTFVRIDGGSSECVGSTLGVGAGADVGVGGAGSRTSVVRASGCSWRSMVHAVVTERSRADSRLLGNNSGGPLGSVVLKL